MGSHTSSKSGFIQNAALEAAVLDVVLNHALCSPRELDQALVDAFVQLADVVREQPSLFRGQVVQNGVVGACAANQKAERVVFDT